MSTVGESVLKLLLAHFNADESAFRAAVEEFISEEKRKNHRLFAKELTKLLNKTSEKPMTSHRNLSVLGNDNGQLPHDRERGVLLIEIREPKKELDNLILSETVRSTLNRCIEQNRRADILRSYGLTPARRLLFCGSPGCGKTVTAEALANSLHLPLVLVRLDAVVSSYLGETAANLRKVFEFAKSRPMVLLLDEFDAIGKHRAAEEEHGELKRVVTSLLQMLDGFQSETLTIAASNHQSLLDPALWRRFDEIVFFNKPSKEEISKLLSLYLHQIGVSEDTNMIQISDSLVGMSHADIEHIALDAAKETILTGNNRITSDLLQQAIKIQCQRIKITMPEINSPKSPVK